MKTRPRAATARPTRSQPLTLSYDISVQNKFRFAYGVRYLAKLLTVDEYAPASRKPQLFGPPPRGAAGDFQLSLTGMIFPFKINFNLDT
jgi:hypothetical protein